MANISFAKQMMTLELELFVVLPEVALEMVTVIILFAFGFCFSLDEGAWGRSYVRFVHQVGEYLP